MPGIDQTREFVPLKIAALTVSDTSFTSFPPSKRVRIAPRADAKTRVYEYTPYSHGRAPAAFQFGRTSTRLLP
jgi:hypothetical protein